MNQKMVYNESVHMTRIIMGIDSSTKLNCCSVRDNSRNRRDYTAIVFTEEIATDVGVLERRDLFFYN